MLIDLPHVLSEGQTISSSWLQSCFFFLILEHKMTSFTRNQMERHSKNFTFAATVQRNEVPSAEFMPSFMTRG